MSVSVKLSVTSHVDEVLSDLEKAIQNGLFSIGSTAEGYAKDQCPVDTGRLRNSITFATKQAQGSANSSGGTPAEPADYAMHGKPDENTVVIGTNVEYAEKQEEGNYRHKVGNKHFLRNAVSDHTDEYKRLMETALKSTK